MSAVISAIAIYPLCLCCKLTYGMVKAGGIPVFLLAAFFYLVISLVYASFTMKKGMIQYYMLYIVLQIVVLVEAC